MLSSELGLREDCRACDGDGGDDEDAPGKQLGWTWTRCSHVLAFLIRHGLGQVRGPRLHY